MNMRKKLTISINEKVYDGLHKIIGRRRISRFLEDLARPHVVVDKSLESAYADMANDELREKEALDWVEGVVGDVSDEAR